MSEETPMERYNRIHAEPVDLNAAAAMNRRRYGLSGNYEKDLADGKIDPNGHLILDPPGRTVLP